MSGPMSEPSSEFTNPSSAASIRVRPFWEIRPVDGEDAGSGLGPTVGGKLLLLAPGAGWGDGLHETTQLCLQAIALFAPRPEGERGWAALDFGSGSGLLSIACARLGAKVRGVEIDPSGIAHAELNARINGIADRFEQSEALPDPARPSFDLVVANILRPILLEFAYPLASRLSPGGVLILSGLVATDVPDVSVRYAGFLGGRMPEVYRRGEWCALVWRGRTPAATS